MSYSLNMTYGKKRVDPKKVRRAEPEETESVMKLCRQLAKENAMFNIDEEKVREGVEGAINGTGGILGVIGNLGEIEGMMMIRIAQFWYSNDFYLDELFAFVPPKYRRSENAKKLIDWSKNLADDMGLPLFVGIISTTRTEAKVRLYRRMFGDFLGCFFMHGRMKKGDTEH